MQQLHDKFIQAAQFSGSFLQSMLQRNRSQAIHPTVNQEYCRQVQSAGHRSPLYRSQATGHHHTDQRATDK